MIPVPTGVRLWLATSHTDMCKSFSGLALQAQEVLRCDPLEVVWYVGQGACLFTKRLKRGTSCGRAQPTAW